MIYHNVILHVREDDTSTTSQMIDIIQGSDNSHTINIKLYTDKSDCNYPYDISGMAAAVHFITRDPETGKEKLVVSSAPKIINSARGELSWIVSHQLLKEIGRYTAELQLYRELQSGELVFVKGTFIINVVKAVASKPDPSEVEVGITEEFYNDLVNMSSSLNWKTLGDSKEVSPCANEEKEPNSYPSFISCDTQAVYDEHSSELNDDDIVFVKDSQRIYRGTQLISNVGLKILKSEPTLENTVTNCLYVYTPTDPETQQEGNPELWINDGTKVVQLGASSQTSGVSKNLSFIYTGLVSGNVNINDDLLGNLIKHDYNTEEGFSIQMYPSPCQIVIISKDYRNLEISDPEVTVGVSLLDYSIGQGKYNIWVLKYEKEVYEVLKVKLT